MVTLDLNLRRLNRISYLLTLAASMFIFITLGLVLSMITNMIAGVDGSDSPNPLFMMPIIIFWFIYFFICSVKRLHDIGLSGWLSLGIFLPFVGFILAVVLVLYPGSENSNKYGEPRNGLQIMGLLAISSKKSQFHV